MKTDENLFRSAVMGGFNREDVTAYLEKTSAAHSQELEALRSDLEAAESARRLAEDTVCSLEARCRQQEERIEQLDEALEGTRKECSRLQAEGEDRAQQLAAAREALRQREEEDAAREAETGALKAQVTVLAEVQRALSRKSEALSAAERELEALRAERAPLQADAEAYHAIKDRLAGIELEAHQRAQAAEDAAALRAAETRAAVEAWLADLQKTYGVLRSAMDAAAERTQRELSGVLDAVDRVSGRFAAGEAALGGIAEQYGTAATEEA